MYRMWVTTTCPRKRDDGRWTSRGHGQSSEIMNHPVGGIIHEGQHEQHVWSRKLPVSEWHLQWMLCWETVISRPPRVQRCENYTDVCTIINIDSSIGESLTMVRYFSTSQTFLTVLWCALPTWLAGFTLSPELFPAHGHLWRLGGSCWRAASCCVHSHGVAPQIGVSLVWHLGGSGTWGAPTIGGHTNVIPCHCFHWLFF